MFQKFSTRILLGYSFPIFGLFLLGSALFVSAKQTITLQEEVEALQDALIHVNELTYSASKIGRAARGYVLFPEDDSYVSVSEDAYADFSEDVKVLNTLKSSLQPEVVSLIENLTEEGETLYQDVQSVYQLMAQSQLAEAKITLKTIRFFDVDEVRDSFLALTTQQLDKKQAILNRNEKVLIVVVSLGTVMLVIISGTSGILITNAIKDQLSKLVNTVENNSIQVTSAATEIAASGKQLETSITEQMASTNQVATSAKEIEYITMELASTIETVSHAVQSTNIAASNSQNDLVLMEGTMTQLAESTASISQKLGLINDKANNINSAVVTITKVADQTNLLSLNAAIEAEKAGEYGAGFSVVAREIRRLADQTAIATLDIEAMVKDMQSAVASGVMEMDQFGQSVQTSVSDIHKISERVIQIIEQIQSITPQFEVVNQNMSNQSEGTQQIREAMEQLSQVSQQNSTSLSETNSALSQLNIASQILRDEITNLQIRI